MEFFPLIIVKENSWFVGSAFQQEQLPPHKAAYC